MTVCLKLIKTTLQLTLLIAFLNFFGVPSVLRYQHFEAVIVKSIKPSDGFPLPDVTVCAKSFEGPYGWRHDPPVNSSVKWGGKYGNIEAQCGHMMDIEQCVLDQTFTKEDIFKKVFIGYTDKTVLMIRNSLNRT